MTDLQEMVWKQHVNQGLSEADLVAEFYHQCRLRGWHCELEQSLPSPKHPSGQMRADAVIKRKKHCAIICAVEFKKYGNSSKDSSWQSLGYASQRFPVLYCIGAHQIFETIDVIEVLVSQLPDCYEDEDFWDLLESSHQKGKCLY